MENMTDTADVEGDPSFIEAAPVIVARPKAKPPAATPAPASPRFNALEIADEIALRDWISSLSGEGEIKINIFRKKPIAGPNGEAIGGSLETVTDRIDEDYIREMWGGGTFKLAIQAMTPQGDYKYVKGGNRQIVIAGPPKMGGQLLTREGTGAALSSS